MKQSIKLLILFTIGGLIYTICEVIWKSFSGGRVHWSMFVLGGLLFIIIGYINEYIPWEMSLILQTFIGGVVITVGELITGLIVNIWLGLDVWDYSALPFNFLGQICLSFSVLWFFVATIAIILDDYLRYRLFGEEKPHYKII